MSNLSATLYIMTRTSYIWWEEDDDVYFVQEEHAELDFYSASSLKRSVDRHFTLLGLIILIPSHNISKTLLNVTYNYHNLYPILISYQKKKIGWGQGIRWRGTGYIFPVASVNFCCNVQYEQIISNATRYPQCIIHNVVK